MRRVGLVLLANGVSLACAVLKAAYGASGAGEPVFRWSAGDKPREFFRADDVITMPIERKLDGARSASLAAWFMLRRPGEQVIVSRGLPEMGPGGERFFRPAEDWVNFVLGTDQHGFLMGCIHGNSRMPFPLVTLAELTPGEWHHSVIVKQADGGQRFYHNGALVYSDANSAHAGKVWPFIDKKTGDPLRLSLPLGGAMAEVTLWAHELSAGEVQAAWNENRLRLLPNHPGQPCAVRRMHGKPGIQPIASSQTDWENRRKHVLAEWNTIVGAPGKPSADVGVSQVTPIEEADCGGYLRRKVSIPVQANDRMPAWLLIPKKLSLGEKRAAVICLYGTTSGAGKDTTVGLSGAAPGTPPERNRAFAIDMVEAGFVALAPDLLRDGERLPPSRRPYDTTDFYEKYPAWSCVGKDCWDAQRAIDYLETLAFVDGERIGIVGHSYGGHTAIFAAGFEPRIRAVFASGPVSDFVKHGLHWAVPKGAGNSQSLPNMRPYLIEGRDPPVSFAEVTALIAPRPLWVNQAVGEWRPNEEENAAAVGGLYHALGAGERVRYMWCAGDHDFPPVARQAAVAWFRKWLGEL